MSRAKTLEYLCGLANMREQDLRRSLQSQQHLLAQLRQKFAVLEGYLQQYGAEFQQRQTESISGPELLQWRGFLGQLADVLAQQRMLIAEQQERLTALEDQWRSVRAQEQGLQRMQQRLFDEQKVLLMRRLQKDLDDWALRAARWGQSR